MISQARAHSSTEVPHKPVQPPRSATETVSLYEYTEALLVLGLKAPSTSVGKGDRGGKARSAHRAGRNAELAPASPRPWPSWPRWSYRGCCRP